ncbi:unnamed protein product [Paramecium sonneborni]|uniref:Transmembrane protein n=1 Tax=Paramecium sonneborni TaxID=65129 RepID=A0A8S1Q3J7_9CILI|nr:unnamed protein product [Paramecium sonneborni]
MLKKLQQQAKEAYNQKFGKEKYQEMEEEKNNKQPDSSFSQFNATLQFNQVDNNLSINNNQEQIIGMTDRTQIDFTKALIPEELQQQMQEQEIKEIAIQNNNKEYKKPKKNDDMPEFLTKKICLNENGENYYEIAAKKAKEQNSTLFQLKHFVSTKAISVQQQVKKSLKKLDAHVKKKILEKKQHINLWIAGQLDTKIVSLMSNMEPKISESVKKSVPFDFMQDFMHDTAINLWKDFTDLVRLEIRAKLDTKKVEIKKRDVKGLLSQFKNFILYSLYPADLTTKDHMSRISYKIIKLLQFTPYMGLQPLIFSIILLCIHKEEYQLVNYIADYKSIQFLTNGLFPCLIAYFYQFFYDQGPGKHHSLFVLTITFLAQFINIWIAFYLLKQSHSKGEALKAELTITQEEKGGRLRYFLIYDLICLIIVVGVSIIIYIEHTINDPKQSFGDLLFFTRTIYAFLSFPFIIFIFPFFVKLLTNAISTGYDKYGNCIQALNSIQMSYQQAALTRKEDVDIEEIIDQDDQQIDDNVDKSKKQNQRLNKTVG